MKADEFIREECEWDEMMGEEGFIEYCDGCNEPVYEEDEAIGVVVRQGDGTDLPVCICGRCLKEMSHKDLLDLLEIPWFENVSYAWDLARGHKMNRNANLRRVVTTAAQMMKEARA